MPRLRRTILVMAAAASLLLVAQPVPGQGTVPPPAAVYLQSWPLSITPNDVAPDPRTGNMAVVDAGDSVIQLLRPGGSHLGQLRGLQDPRSAAFTPDGILLVGEAGTGSVRGYDLAGGVQYTLGTAAGEFLTPNDIAVHPSGALAYVADSAADTVKAYTLPDGTFQFAFGSTGTGDGQLRFPISVTVDGPAGEVFVGDSRNRRIAVFDAADGTFLRNIGVAGGGGGEISFVGGLHADQAQHLFVVESLGGYVQVFDPFGTAVSQIGDRGTGPGQLRSPKSVAVDRFNRLLVTSFLNKKIEVWGLDTYENPVDEDLVASTLAIPRRLTLRRAEFSVTVSVPGVYAAFLDPDSIRLNGVLPPVSGTSRVMGPHLVVKFRTDQVLALITSGTALRASLPLTGKTFDGLRFEGTLDLIAAAPPSTFQGRKQQVPSRWRYRP